MSGGIKGDKDFKLSIMVQTDRLIHGILRYMMYTGDLDYKDDDCPEYIPSVTEFIIILEDGKPVGSVDVSNSMPQDLWETADMRHILNLINERTGGK